MKRIKLFNRDGADLYLEKTSKKINDNTFEWKLVVDDEHSYVLNYCRYIYKEGHFKSIIECIDPSGGPFLSVGDTYSGHKIVQINSAKSIYLSEGHNDN